MHLRECQGSVQHTLSVCALEGNTPRVLRTVRRIKKGGGNSPLFPQISPGRCEASALWASHSQTSVTDIVTTPCLSSAVSKTNRSLDISETDCIDKKAKTPSVCWALEQLSCRYPGPNIFLLFLIFHAISPIHHVFLLLCSKGNPTTITKLPKDCPVLLSFPRIFQC